MTSERVYVEVSGLTGTGKSAVMGEIEIALRAIGLTVEHDVGFQSEKNMTHADWQTALDIYNPVVVLRERNIPRSTARATPPAQGEAVACGRDALVATDNLTGHHLSDLRPGDLLTVVLPPASGYGWETRNQPPLGAVVVCGGLSFTGRILLCDYEPDFGWHPSRFVRTTANAVLLEEMIAILSAAPTAPPPVMSEGVREAATRLAEIAAAVEFAPGDGVAFREAGAVKLAADIRTILAALTPPAGGEG